MTPLTIEEIDEACSVLEDMKAVASEPTPQLDAVLGTLHWVIGKSEGKAIGQFIALAFTTLDQLNAKARDIADSAED